MQCKTKQSNALLRLFIYYASILFKNYVQIKGDGSEIKKARVDEQNQSDNMNYFYTFANIGSFD